MGYCGFLDAKAKAELTRVARNRREAGCVVKRALALPGLDRGESMAALSRLLLLDEETLRRWHPGVHGPGHGMAEEFCVQGKRV